MNAKSRTTDLHMGLVADGHLNRVLNGSMGVDGGQAALGPTFRYLDSTNGR